MTNQKPKLVINAKPKVKHTMSIQVLDDGNINVTGIVRGLDENLNLLAAATRAVSNLFCKAAMEGTAEMGGQIIKPVSPLVVPGRQN